VSDPDNHTTQLYYENASFTNQITKVVDPFSRTNLLAYDASGFLSNIVDVAGLASSFRYDSGTRRAWITNLITPYGTTAFRFGGVNADSSGYYDGSNQVNRFVEVTQPNGGKHLYLYRQDCSGILPATNSPVPVTSPFANTLDNVDQNQRNSFHWDPLQYAGLSTNYVLSGDVANLTTNDYVLAGLRHWLLDPATAQVSRVLSLERKPSPDGVTLGQKTWLDYEGKTGNNSNGTTALPKLEARVLPDGTTWYERAMRNSRGSVTNFVSTCAAASGGVALRTNTYDYAAGEVDLICHFGPQGEQVVSNYFNGCHQPLATCNALNEATPFTYNPSNQITRVVSPAGLTTTNVYFTSGNDVNRLQKTIELETGRTNSYTYYANGLVYSHTDQRGLTTTNYWDNLGRLTGVHHPDGTTTSNLYTALDLTATKDRLGYWSYFGYNAVRQKIAETNANNVVTRYGYCECGALFSVTNAWGTSAEMVTSFGYDYQGHRLYTIYPDGIVTNYFDAAGRMTNASDAWGSRWFYYNNQGLVTNVSTAYGAEQTTVYDLEDRPIWVTAANGVTVTNTYDDLGRRLTRTYPDGGVERFGYSARGLTAYTNQLDKTNYYGYDEAGRKTAETNANNEIIRYTNNAAGDLIALVDGKGQVTKWNYDEYGRVTNKVDQAGTEILRYKYDPDSRLTNRWSVAKGDTKYKYDPVGNLTNIDYAVSTDVSFKYDALNRVTNMVDAVGTTSYGYAAGGQLWTEDGPWSSDTVTNLYSYRLRTALGLAQPTGAWTNGFGYDAMKRLTNVTSQAGTFAYTYRSQPSTLISQLALPNTSYLTNTYDTVARLTGTYLKNSSHTTLDSATYGYNAGHQRTSSTNAASATVSYTYDKIGQLKVADSSTNSEDRGYFYDAAWNLNYRTNNGTLNTFNVDNKNQLTNSTPSGGTQSYDANGNLILSHSTEWAFTYDDENQLAQVFYCDAGYSNGEPTSDIDVRTDLVYDGRGRLRQRVEYEVSAGEWTVVSETRYVYDGMRVIQERNSGNTPTVSYTRGNDLSGSLEGAGGIGGLLGRSHGYSGGNWSTHNFYHADGNGNITYLVNSSQGLAASYRYDPFGNTITSSGSLVVANVYRFSSKECLQKTGSHKPPPLYYYGYRWYWPNLQRWLNRDPIGERGGMNLYTFVGNTPINGVDLFGLVGGGGVGGPQWFPPYGPPKYEGTPPDWHRNRNRNQDHLCPKTEPKNDPQWKPDNPIGEAIFHKCNECYRGTGRVNSGAQCCYDEKGNPVTGKWGAGSFDYYPPGSETFWWYWHIVFDVLPPILYGPRY